MIIEYKGNRQLWICDNCKKEYYVSIGLIPPESCDCDNKIIDPWLYENAILQVWNGNSLDRKTIVYTGQVLEYEHYVVRGTPWEMIPKDVKKIKILECSIVEYTHQGKVSDFVWINCPESLKFYGHYLHRPKWTKYLPGINK